MTGNNLNKIEYRDQIRPVNIAILLAKVVFMKAFFIVWNLKNEIRQYQN